MTDEKIAVGLKKQDTEALVCLMERYSNYISSIIGQLLKNYGNVQDTEELMADVFLTIWNTADKLNMDAYSSLKGYIGTIARNKAKDFLRKKRFVTLALDMNVQTVKSHLSRGRKFLKKVLVEEYHMNRR